MKIQSRLLNDTDFDAMKSLLWRDGPNEWNYITDDSIALQFQQIKRGCATAILAESFEDIQKLKSEIPKDKFPKDKLMGFAILLFREACPSRLSKYTTSANIAYINDVVVGRNHHGKGLGTKLLLTAVEEAKQKQIEKVYIERHEENLASAGMMRKAGFQIVETFDDAHKRTSGSRRTSILEKIITR